MRKIILRMSDGDYLIKFDQETKKVTINLTGPSSYACTVKRT